MVGGKRTWNCTHLFVSSRSIEPVHLLGARELPRRKRDSSLPLLHSEHILPDAPYNLEHEKERETTYNEFQHELTDNQFYAQKPCFGKALLPETCRGSLSFAPTTACMLEPLFPRV